MSRLSARVCVRYAVKKAKNFRRKKFYLPTEKGNRRDRGFYGGISRRTRKTRLWIRANDVKTTGDCRRFPKRSANALQGSGEATRKSGQKTSRKIIRRKARAFSTARSGFAVGDKKIQKIQKKINGGFRTNGTYCRC